MLNGKKLNWLITACVVTVILAVYAVWLWGQTGGF